MDENLKDENITENVPGYEDTNGIQDDIMPEKERKSFFKTILIVLLICTVVAETAFIASHFIVPSSGKKPDASADADRQATLDTITEIDALFKNYYVNELDETELDDKMILAYLLSTGDQYCDYYTAEQWAEENAASNGDSYGIGANVVNTEEGIVVVHIMTDSPASMSDLQIGDTIIATDGQSVLDMSYYDALELIRGEKGTEVNLTVIRDGSEIVIPVTRGSYTSETVRSSFINRDGKKLARIYISEFLYITAEQFKNAVDNAINEGCDGIVFDVRNNSGGRLETVTDILDYLLPEGPITSIEYKDSNRNMTYKSDADYVTDLPMVVLANGSTASGGELFTSALQDYGRATVIGTQTYGKGCGQSYYTLSNGDVLRMTSFFYLPPYSENYDGVGIEPDIVCELSEEAQNKIFWLLTSEEDTQLGTAIDTLLKKIGKK